MYIYVDMHIIVKTKKAVGHTINKIQIKKFFAYLLLKIELENRRPDEYWPYYITLGSKSTKPID